MKIIEETKIVKFIEYDGIRFYQDKKGYWLSSKHKRLHIYVWEKYHGEIPRGYHIHHKDFNTDNNEIDNLELLSENEHLSLHGQLEKNKAFARKNMNEVVRPKAIEWHKSEKSRELHKEHYKNTLGKLHSERIPIICVVCNKEFMVDACKTDSKFCSNPCKSQYRRNIGVDTVERICVVCGNAYTNNKYSKGKTCSRPCRMEMRFKKV